MTAAVGRGRIAIVGSGIAGVTCAHVLGGFRERHDRLVQLTLQR